MQCLILVYRIPVVVNIKGYEIHFLIRTVCQILIAFLLKKIILNGYSWSSRQSSSYNLQLELFLLEELV